MAYIGELLLGIAAMIFLVFLLRAAGLSPKPQMPRGRDGQVVTRPQPMPGGHNADTIILGNPTGGGK
jgi:hypothetical protein